jgi:hypothetical protein
MMGIRVISKNCPEATGSDSVVIATVPVARILGSGIVM